MDLQAFRHGLFAEVPVPHDSEGRIDVAAQTLYVAWMRSQPIRGVMVWTQVGRGLKLDDRGRSAVLSAWRDGLGDGRVVIAAVGSTTTDRRPDRVIASAQAMARDAAKQGADALLVWPPTLFRGLNDGDSLILEYHAAVADAGLPLIVFALYETAGGVSYSPQLLAQLMARPEVWGIRICTLSNVMTYQQYVELVRQFAPTKLIFTGEERFLGYSLMCGADAAILATAAACPRLQSDFLESFWSGNSDRFLELNPRIDDLAQHTFLAPMDGSVGRILCCLVHESVIPAEAAHDPWGPRLATREFSQIGECLTRVGLPSTEI